jgi:hypothetical protein
VHARVARLRQGPVTACRRGARPGRIRSLAARRAGATVPGGAEDRLTGQPANGHCRVVPRPMGCLYARRSPNGDSVHPSRLMRQREQPAGVQLRVDCTAVARRPEQLRGRYILHRKRGRPAAARPGVRTPVCHHRPHRRRNCCSGQPGVAVAGAAALAPANINDSEATTIRTCCMTPPSGISAHREPNATHDPRFAIGEALAATSRDRLGRQPHTTPPSLHLCGQAPSPPSPASTLDAGTPGGRPPDGT